MSDPRPEKAPANTEKQAEAVALRVCPLSSPAAKLNHVVLIKDLRRVFCIVI